MILLIVHQKHEQFLPKVPSSKKFIDNKFQQLRDIVDIAFFDTVYECSMNKKACQKLKKLYNEGK